MKIIRILISVFILFSTFSCRDEEKTEQPEIGRVTEPYAGGTIRGFYLLNEGNMGTNKASLDFFDYRTGIYNKNIYPSRNPNVLKKLGDVGNDIQIYGNKLYAIINCSNKVEVMDKWTAKRIKKIDIPNCRYIKFYKDKAYVSSYSGPVEIKPNAEIGFVAEVDTATLEVIRKVQVGYQPEEMVIHEGKLYIANSGGYRVPNYDRTVSVVDLETFTETKKIDVGVNLHRMQIDQRGDIYVSSRGDYYDIPSKLFVIDSKTDEVKQTLDIPITHMTMDGDSLYFYSTEWSHYTGKFAVTYGIIDTRSKKLINDKIITDGTDSKILMPYGIKINPETKEIFITDAQDFVVNAYVYCFSSEGKFKWKTLAGNIPGHFVFLHDK